MSHGTEDSGLLVLSEDDVRRALAMPAAIRAVADAFARLSAGRARVPVRQALDGDGGDVLFMPGRLDTPSRIGAKAVSVFPGNPAERDLPAVNAGVLLVDPETGRPAALIAGNHLTAVRTGAGSGVATDRLAREDASVLALFGAGAQARTQLRAVAAVRELREVRVVSRSGASARAFAREHHPGDERLPEVRAAEDPADALRGADVVVTATDSAEPVFDGRLVEPGTHVNAVGSYTPEMQELDAGLVTRATVVVDHRASVLEEAGDLLIPIREGRFSEEEIHAEIGEVVSGDRAGRTGRDEITLFESVGNVVQDLAAASLAVRAAREQGLGTRVPF